MYKMDSYLKLSHIVYRYRRGSQLKALYVRGTRRYYKAWLEGINMYNIFELLGAQCADNLIFLIDRKVTYKNQF